MRYDQLSEEIQAVTEHIHLHCGTARLRSLTLSYDQFLKIFISFSNGICQEIVIERELPIAHSVFTTRGIFAQPDRWRYQDALRTALTN